METNKTAQTQWIDVGLIDVPEHFREHAANALEALSQDIQQHGLLQEIVVTPKPESRLELVAGKGRLTVIRKLGWAQIRAQILTGLSELDKVMISISENEEREDVSPIDKAVSYRRAMQVGQIDQRELAKQRGMTESAMSAYITLLNSPQEALENFKRLKFSMGQLTQLIRIQDEELQKKLAQECAEKDWTVRDLQAAVNKALNAKPEGGKGEGEGKEVAQPAHKFSWKGEAVALRPLPFSPATENLDQYLENLKSALAEFLTQHPELKKTPAETAVVLSAAEEVPAIAA